jgi:hypothetical protein
LRDLLASWVAAQGAAAILVFDGEGTDEQLGPLAGAVGERRVTRCSSASPPRIATESRSRSSPPTRDVRATMGIDVRKFGSQAFLGELSRPGSQAPFVATSETGLTPKP